MSAPSHSPPAGSLERPESLTPRRVARAPRVTHPPPGHRSAPSHSPYQPNVRLSFPTYEAIARPLLLYLVRVRRLNPSHGPVLGPAPRPANPRLGPAGRRRLPRRVARQPRARQRRPLPRTGRGQRTLDGRSLPRARLYDEAPRHRRPAAGFGGSRTRPRARHRPRLPPDGRPARRQHVLATAQPLRRRAQGGGRSRGLGRARLGRLAAKLAGRPRAARLAHLRAQHLGCEGPGGDVPGGFRRLAAKTGGRPPTASR